MSLDEEIAARLEKLQKLKKENIDPYPAQTERSHTVAQMLSSWPSLVESGAVVTVTGRLKTKRAHGGLVFADIEDGTGTIQIAVKRDVVGDEIFTRFADLSDLGDFWAVAGTSFVTKKGERTISANTVTLLTKTLLPLPEKWHGLTDVEVRFRKRYLDLISNELVRDIFKKRSLIVRAIRTFFDERGYLEVETPILQTLAGGANAEPFITHHNTLGIDLYLRIAPELYLKRLLVGGMEKVYEMARCFRNEGMDHLHNPEFTQIEAYEAYANYRDYMKLVEELLPFVARAIGLDVTAVPFEDTTIDFTPPYPRMTFNESLEKYGKFKPAIIADHKKLIAEAEARGVAVLREWGYGKLLDELFKTFARPHILQPTFIIDHPIELSPLTKRKFDDPLHVERFQLLVGKGIELVNSFSELNDPIDQEARFASQEAARVGGDTEAQRLDDDFITALKHGMPPAAGLGLGIDRLVALLTNTHSIKEVILFPTLRPE